MDASQDHFLVTGGYQGRDSRQDFLTRPASFPAARQRDDAVGTMVVAAVLDFDEGAGVTRSVHW
jgi:hypothetical protein